MGQDVEKLRRSTALFLLKMKHKQRVSQVVIDDMVQECRALVDNVIICAKAGVFGKLANAGITHSDIEGLSDVFDNLGDPFEGIDTCYKQEKYYKEQLGLIVCFIMYVHVMHTSYNGQANYIILCTR